MLCAGLAFCFRLASIFKFMYKIRAAIKRNSLKQLMRQGIYKIYIYIFVYINMCLYLFGYMYRNIRIVPVRACYFHYFHSALFAFVYICPSIVLYLYA